VTWLINVWHHSLIPGIKIPNKLDHTPGLFIGKKSLYTKPNNSHCQTSHNNMSLLCMMSLYTDVRSCDGPFYEKDFLKTSTYAWNRCIYVYIYILELVVLRVPSSLLGSSVLQCVTVCCSVLQCVAVCCSVLQCVAVCCSVLQCVAEIPSRF